MYLRVCLLYPGEGSRLTDSAVQERFGLDRRRALRTALPGAASLVALPALIRLAAADMPAAPKTTTEPPQASGRAGEPNRSATAPSAAWINYEFMISWERVSVLQEVVTGLIGKGVTDLTLLISSNGGDLAAAISTFNFLTSAGIRLTTCNIGNVYSAGIVLYLAGDRRIADLATQFIIHPPSQSTAAGTMTAEDLHTRSESLDHDATRMRDLIAARSRMTAAQLDPMLVRPAFISPQQALAYGLATEVGHLVRPASVQLVTMPAPPR